MKVSAHLSLLTLCIVAAGCTQGNERVAIGNGRTHNEYKLSELIDTGEPPPISSDAASTNSLGRENWAPTTVRVPVDGLASHPHYNKPLFFTDKTARQRGEQPTALTALELDGEVPWTTAGEAAVAGPLALWDNTRMLVWDFWAEPLWKEKVRPPMIDYQRAQPGTYRVSREQRAELAESARGSAEWYGAKKAQSTATAPERPEVKSEVKPVEKPVAIPAQEPIEKFEEIPPAKGPGAA